MTLNRRFQDFRSQIVAETAVIDRRYSKAKSICEIRVIRG
jgi:hypothetical protein